MKKPLVSMVYSKIKKIRVVSAKGLTIPIILNKLYPVLQFICKLTASTWM